MFDQYLTVVSSYNTDIFPNTSSCFKNQLCTELACPKNCEVSLVEISILNKFLVDKDSDGKLSLFNFEFTKDGGVSFGKWYHLSLKKAAINSPWDLVYMLNSFIWSEVSHLKEKNREIFLYKEGKIWLNFEKDDFILIIIKGALLVLLGADDQDSPQHAVIAGKSKEKLSYIWSDGTERKFSSDCQQRLESCVETTDFFEFTPKLPVYDQFLCLSNLASETPVANYLVKLLRWITIDPSTAAKRTTISFPERIYIPLNEDNIQSIEIHLKSLDNKFLDIEGVTRCTLHIREKKQ